MKEVLLSIVEAVEILLNTPMTCNEQASAAIQAINEGLSACRQAAETLPPSISLIIDERLRQINAEGWTAEHDDSHDSGELALIAALYATPEPLFRVGIHDERKVTRPGYRGATVEIEDPWPADWDERHDKREKVDRVRLLTMAGALIAAEIDRLLRAQESERCACDSAYGVQCLHHAEEMLT